jgi:hypothetical protein
MNNAKLNFGIRVNTFDSFDLSPQNSAMTTMRFPVSQNKRKSQYEEKRFTEEQIMGALKEHEAGARIDDICRRISISTGTFYN